MITLDLKEVGVLIEALDELASHGNLTDDESALYDKLIAARDAE